MISIQSIFYNPKKLIDNNSISMNFLSLRAISKLSIFCCLNVPVSDFIFRK